jgi:large subunit ribosomal protein L11
MKIKMAKETVEVLIEGGKATAAPPLGPALGPFGINIGKVVSDINKKTADFKGMKVPVKVVIDTETKEYDIKIGTPPAAELIKQEAGIKTASGNPLTSKVADLKIEQVIKVAQMKADALLGKNDISRVKEIIGTCDSMGVMVEGKQAREIIADINNGSFVDKIKSGKTELSAEELKEQEEEKKLLDEEIAKKRQVYEAQARKIMDEFKNKDNSAIRKKMMDAKIPDVIINELAPAEDKKK